MRPKHEAGWFRGVIVAIQSLVLCNCFYWAQRPFEPSYPTATRDGSWVTVSGEDAARLAHGGQEAAFTFNPASSLYTSYYSELFPYLNVFLGLIIAAIFGVGASLLMARPGRSWPIALLATVVLAASTTFTLLSRDALFLAMAVIVLLLAFRPNEFERSCKVATTLGAMALGVIALSKTTFGISAFGLLLIADVGRIAHRRVSLLTISFLFSGLLTYLALGQSLSTLPRFLELNGEVVRGYGEAMAMQGSTKELIAFLVISAVLGALIVVVERNGMDRSRRHDTVLLLLGLGFYWMLAFKAGFVRHDLHSLIGWQALGFGMILYALSCRLPNGLGRVPVFGLLTLGVTMVILVAPMRWALAGGNDPLFRLGGFYVDRFVHMPVRHWSALSDFVSDPLAWLARADAQKEQAWVRIRESMPFPRIEGSVDIIPSQQAAVIANRLHYQHRPVFLEYLSYTSRLIEANRAFFESSGAPDWLLFAPGSIEGRYPSSAEGALWPDFLRLYEPVRLSRDLLLLHRRSQPLSDLTGKVRHVDARPGQIIAVEDEGAVFVKIALRRTWIGRIFDLLYRPPTAMLNIKTRAGPELQYRLIPEMAASGFLLSPRIDNVKTFLALSLGFPEAIEPEKVETISVNASDWGRRAYSDNIDIEFITINTGELRRGGHSPELIQGLR
jgi:hypothetical protein